MLKLRINNIECDFEDGATVFEVARSIGIELPVMCHRDGVEHYSSCMVCMVKDNRTKGYIPSCSALALPGMDIDTIGSDVTDLRKKALELLLSEHRAECEAPCRVVCPAGYNIPLMNRLLIAGDIKKAVELSLSENSSFEVHCADCPAYCENACRRKKVDSPVSIRNLQMFISLNTKSDHSPKLKTPIEERKKSLQNIKRFRSLIGKLEPSELNEWIKESTGSSTRFREIPDIESACSEAGSCMHCDCRAADDCKLRELSEMMGMKDPRGKIVYAPAEKKINYDTNLIFENAKCIKCGLCVRVSGDKTDNPSLCFINRGFISIISEPLTCKFVETMKTTASECIEVCPTGALAFFK